MRREDGIGVVRGVGWGSGVVSIYCDGGGEGDGIRDLSGRGMCGDGGWVLSQDMG